MTNKISQRENFSSGYPGEYHPLSVNLSEVMKRCQSAGSGAVRPLVNIIESDPYYSVEIVAPGHSREEFLVMVDNGRLNIYVVCQKKYAEKFPLYLSQEFNVDCFEYSMKLPANVDTDFVKAEYNAGILRFDFQRVNHNCTQTVDRIIVY